MYTLGSHWYILFSTIWQLKLLLTNVNDLPFLIKNLSPYAPIIMDDAYFLRPRNGQGAKNSKWKYMSRVGFEPTPDGYRILI